MFVLVMPRFSSMVAYKAAVTLVLAALQDAGQFSRLSSDQIFIVFAKSYAANYFSTNIKMPQIDENSALKKIEKNGKFRH